MELLPPKIPGGHILLGDGQGSVDLDTTFMPGPHRGVYCIVCKTSYCILCSEDAIETICPDWQMTLPGMDYLNV